MCIRDRINVSVLTATERRKGGKKTLNPDAEAKLSPIKAAIIVASTPMIIPRYGD